MKALRKVVSSVVATIMGTERPVSSVPVASQQAYDDFQQSIASERAEQRARHGKVTPVNQRQRDTLHAALAGGERRR